MTAWVSVNDLYSTEQFHFQHAMVSRVAAHDRCGLAWPARSKGTPKGDPRECRTQQRRPCCRSSSLVDWTKHFPHCPLTGWHKRVGVGGCVLFGLLILLPTTLSTIGSIIMSDGYNDIPFYCCSSYFTYHLLHFRLILNLDWERQSYLTNEL